MNYYELLGVSNNATKEEIEAAYKNRKNNDDGKYLEIRYLDAIITLTDDSKRKQYDKFLIEEDKNNKKEENKKNKKKTSRVKLRIGAGGLATIMVLIMSYEGCIKLVKKNYETNLSKIELSDVIDNNSEISLYDELVKMYRKENHLDLVEELENIEANIRIFDKLKQIPVEETENNNEQINIEEAEKLISRYKELKRVKINSLTDESLELSEVLAKISEIKYTCSKYLNSKKTYEIVNDGLTLALKSVACSNVSLSAEEIYNDVGYSIGYKGGYTSYEDPHGRKHFVFMEELTGITGNIVELGKLINAEDNDLNCEETVIILKESLTGIKKLVNNQNGNVKYKFNRDGVILKEKVKVLA